MKHLLVRGLTLLALIAGCQPAKEQVEYRLQDDALTRLMLDVQLSEAVLQGTVPQRQDSLKEMFWLRMTAIYHMDKDELKAEIRKLEQDPEKLKLIFERMKTAVDSIQ